MAITVTLKTLQQQTFKIRMEPEETVRAGARGRERPAVGRGGWGQGGPDPTGGAGRTCGRALLPFPSDPTSSHPPSHRPCPAPGLRRPSRVGPRASPQSRSCASCRLRIPSLQAARVTTFGVSGQEVPTGDNNVDNNKWS